jgi:hypothetical protein
MFFGAVDLNSLDGCETRRIQMRAPGTRRGSDREVPRRRGAIGVPGLPYAQYSFTVTVKLHGTSPEDFEENLDAISAALQPSGDSLGLLTRRRPKTASPFYFDQNANGRYIDGFAFDILNDRTGVTELQFVNLSGAWTDDEDPNADDATWVL